MAGQELDVELEGWNPMKEDYEDVEFNSYDRGPGRNLPKDIREHQNVTTLVIKGVPADLNQNGLRNIFVKYGEVKKANIWSGNQGFSTNMGFVTMSSAVECMHAMKGENGRSIGPNKLTVQLSHKRDQDDRSGASREASRSDEPTRGQQGLNSNFGSKSQSAPPAAPVPQGAGFGEVGAGFKKRDGSSSLTSPSAPQNTTPSSMTFVGEAATQLLDTFAGYTPTRLHGGATYIKINVDLDTIQGPDDMWAIALLDLVKAKLQPLEKRLAEYTRVHQNRLVHIAQPQPGDLALSQFEGEWSRATVQLTLPSGVCSVRYIDFGNAAQVERSTLRRLPVELADEPALACPIALSGLTITSPTNQEAVQQALKSLMSKTALADCIITNVHDNSLDVEIFVEEDSERINVAETLLSSPKTAALVQPYVRPALQVGDSVKEAKLLKLAELDTFRILYPNNRFGPCQTEEISQALTNWAQLGPGSEIEPRLGLHVMFKCQNNKWQRGEVQKVSTARRMAYVSHLDDDDMSTQVSFSDIRALPFKYAKIPRQSHPVCRLDGVSEPTVLTRLLRPFMQTSLCVKVTAVKSSSPCVYTVNVFTPDGTDVVLQDGFMPGPNAAELNCSTPSPSAQSNPSPTLQSSANTSQVSLSQLLGKPARLSGASESSRAASSMSGGSSSELESQADIKPSIIKETAQPEQASHSPKQSSNALKPSTDAARIAALEKELSRVKHLLAEALIEDGELRRTIKELTLKNKELQRKLKGQKLLEM